MKFGATDFLITISLTLAIILMSFTLPAMGLTDESDEVSESDIPEFNVSESRFDIVGGFPKAPDPSKGTLVRDLGRTFQFSDNRINYLHGDREDGVRIHANGDQNQENVTVAMQSMSGGGIDSSDQITLRNESETKEIDNDTLEYVVHVTFTELEGGGTSEAKWTIDYEIIERPEDVSFVGGIDIIGDIVGVTDMMIQTVAWGMSISYWFFASVIEFFVGGGRILFDTMSFIFEFVEWQTNTYNSIISAADGFAKVFVTLPGVILSMYLAKAGIIGIRLLPFT